MDRSRRPLLALAGVAALMSACAGSDGPVRGGGGDEPHDQRTPNLFISPAGQPFRAERGQPYPVAAWFAGADADHDGRLTRAEFRADAAAFFALLDTNHDGVIDGFEVQHYEREVAPEINPQIDGLRFGEGMDLGLGKAGRGGADSIGRGPTGSNREEAGDRRPEGAGLFGLLNEPEPVADTDTDFDGHITLQEFQAAADRRFDALDKKQLGYLTLDALPKTPVQTVLERRAKRDHPR
jgi:hypothetical protein